MDEKTPEQESEELAELIREEHALEKQIQPVGFIPATEIEQTMAHLAKRGLDPTNSEEFREQVKRLDVDEEERRKLEELQKRFYEDLVQWLSDNRPGRYFVPNVGQEKAILPLKDVDPEEANVEIGVFGAANAVGKTTMMVNLLIGLIWGVAEMHPFFRAWKIFEKFALVRKRERRPLRMRIICHAGGMEDGGQVFEELTKWWPRGLYHWEKNHKSYYSVCKCWDMDGNLLAIINVRTHDQPRNAHAGHTLDATVADEPLPRHLWQENVTRIRQRMGGILWLFLSPLDEAGWIQDQLSGEDVHFTCAEIWDNCSNWHHDPAMWTGGKVGDGKVITRGHLHRRVIDKMIREWEKEGPEIADARARGLFTHMAGSVLKEFDRAVHVIPSFPIPVTWPIYCCIDPHDGKPHFVSWAAQSPDGCIYFIAELPSMKWGEAKGGQGYAETAKDIREMETPWRDQVVYRIGDPKKLTASVAAVKETTSMQREFREQGFDFKLADNNISVGMSRIRSLLMRDRDNPRSRPRLFIFESNHHTGAPNQNLISGCMNLTYKKGYDSSSSDRDIGSMMVERWKDPVDCIRYTIMSIKDFVPVNSLRRRIVSGARKVINRGARPWM